jgi:hypothetical protein
MNVGRKSNGRRTKVEWESDGSWTDVTRTSNESRTDIERKSDGSRTDIGWQSNGSWTEVERQSDETLTETRRKSNESRTNVDDANNNAISDISRTQDNPSKIRQKFDETPRAPWRWRHCQACVATCCYGAAVLQCNATLLLAFLRRYSRNAALQQQGSGARRCNSNATLQCNALRSRCSSAMALQCNATPYYECFSYTC